MLKHWSYFCLLTFRPFSYLSPFPHLAVLRHAQVKCCHCKYSRHSICAPGIVNVISNRSFCASIGRMFRSIFRCFFNVYLLITCYRHLLCFLSRLHMLLLKAVCLSICSAAKVFDATHCWPTDALAQSLFPLVPLLHGQSHPC